MNGIAFASNSLLGNIGGPIHSLPNDLYTDEDRDDSSGVEAHELRLANERYLKTSDFEASAKHAEENQIGEYPTRLPFQPETARVVDLSSDRASADECCEIEEISARKDV